MAEFSKVSPAAPNAIEYLQIAVAWRKDHALGTITRDYTYRVVVADANGNEVPTPQASGNLTTYLTAAQITAIDNLVDALVVKAGKLVTG